MVKAAIIGSGAWGTTLAKILAENNHNVAIWSHDEQIKDDINDRHENKTLLPKIKLPNSIVATTSLADACQGAEVVLIVVASQYYQNTIKDLIQFLPKKCLIVSASKGLQEKDNKRMSEVLSELLPDEFKNNVLVLSGPNISSEIAQGLPAVTVISSLNNEAALRVQSFFNNTYFRVYTNSDVVGTEYGGILKNIIAIAAGIVDGLGLGDNVKAALIVRGIVEMSRFAIINGAKQETLYGLAGIGDLVTTCASKLSRNHFVGEQLAKGKKLDEIIEGMKAIAEGVRTTKIVYEQAQKEKVDMPVTEQIYQVLFDNKAVSQAISDLMSRDLKAEV